MQALKSSFFMQDTAKVAERLLGSYLIRKTKRGWLVGCIVETEAYLGLKDPACHSFKAPPSGRAKTMYLPGGHSYIYFIYGMHYCFNVVTGGEKEPEAVLIRAVRPVEGLAEMQKNRGREKLADLCNGPGKLCQAFNITKTLNAKDLSREGEIYIAKGKKTGEAKTDRRIGLPLHEDSAYWPLRFYIKSDPFVSYRELT